MSSLQQQQQPFALPSPWSVQSRLSEQTGNQRGPPKICDSEAQMAYRARQNIETRQDMARRFLQYKAQGISNEYEVTVTSEPESEDEIISLTVQKKRKLVPITVKNSGPIAVDFSFFALYFVNNIFTVKDCNGNDVQTIKQYTLESGESYDIKIKFHSKHAGFFDMLLIFKFETREPSSDKFHIMRLIEVSYLTSCSKELEPTTAKKASCDLQPVQWAPQSDVLRFLVLTLDLRTYKMPPNIDDFSSSERTLQTPLNWKNYADRFHLLLHLEEFEQQSEADKFFQESVTISSPSRGLYAVQVPILSKNTAFRLPGCLVHVTLLDQQEIGHQMNYKGLVCHVDGDQVYLKLSEKPQHSIDGMTVSVKFTINRTPLRCEHRSAALVKKFGLREVLFPTGNLSPHHSRLHRLEETGNNPEQDAAIQHIVATTAMPAPYLIFGPPGTGKTVTLVKAIQQIVVTKPLCNILVCAPSNSATDHLCEKIVEAVSEKSEVYRFYSLCSGTKVISQKRQFASNLDHHKNQIILPSRAQLMQYKIMVTTLNAAGRLVSGGIPPDHYSYIFVDEAGQATETASIIPIAGLFKLRTCQVVLAGDPKQLGPIITSRLAKKYGLGLSLLERLMKDFKLYKQHDILGFNSRFVTKLLRNYRSHPAILKIPNELFYKGELQPYAPQEKYSRYCKWELLQKEDFPLIFHGVAGSNERDEDCPSIYNMAEVEVLLEYLKTIIEHLHRKGVTEIGPNEIGIIAPYRKQVEKIQNALQTDKDLCKKNLENIMVGTVERFQGKEAQVILMSAVRSIPKLTDPKQRYSIGFVDSGKRFNVAMTRAQALLIVVGDPRILKIDPLWNKLIHYCYMEGGYRGISLSDEEEKGEEEDILADDHTPSLCEE
ncbi:putative helicase mov-10-B.1 [Cheilinus undulatus]|uniref:putative helicase mov-10-B.1 n=1 Tax=Cheilinus undulatus TaxID=241271 RepID=UPI001BD4EFF2|nr:putative helicase mov-10-B.1 [Cheilinus undulatus]